MDTDYLKILDCIDPSLTNRQEWVQVGMALKEEGCPFSMFDSWSARDTRPKQYRGTEYTYKIWESFKGNGSGIVTGATLTQMARDQGNDPFPKLSGFMDWTDEITSDGEEPKPQPIPSKQLPFKSDRKPVFQIIDYLSVMFQSGDYINVVTSSFTDEDGKHKPTGAGLFSIPVKDYVQTLRKSADSPEFFEDTFGSYDKETGVWVRINPVTGQLREGRKGVSDGDVTRYENALIECDEYSLEEQIRIIKKLKLPYKALVYSGGKSVHAIIKVDGKSLADYKERVNWLQTYCLTNGLPVDTQNKNPSRLSRLPGVYRGQRKQELLEINKSPQDFDDFRQEMEATEQAKDLVIESFADVAENLPPVSEPIIDGILRKGHKLLLSGPSKAGKSFALITLAIAVAQGKSWMGHQCHQGKVLYLNLEIERPSFLHRVDEVYKAYGWEVCPGDNLHILHMRGQAEPLNQLAPKIKARIAGHGYSMIVIDPIYKVITGDENSASDMGKFCNLFDEISRAGECAVAYCHHHSKGTQANKSSIDRASGSGVFARDPDAIIDMTEIAVSELDQEEIKARNIESACDQLMQLTGQWANMERNRPNDLKDRIAKQEALESWFKTNPSESLQAQYRKAVEAAEALGECRAYRLSFTLREFKSPPDINVFFKYPIHVQDTTGVLEQLFLSGDNSIEAMNKKKAEQSQRREDMKRAWYEEQRDAGIMVSVSDMFNHFKDNPAAKCKSVSSVRNWVDKQIGLKRENGWILGEDETAPAKKQRGSANV